MVGENTNNVSVSVDYCSFKDMWTAVYFGHVESGKTGSVSIDHSTYQNVKYGYSIDESTPQSSVGAVTPDYDENNTGDDDMLVSEPISNIVLQSGNSKTVYNDLQAAVKTAQPGDDIILNKGHHAL